MDQALDAGRGGGAGDPPGAFRMHRVETLLARFVEHADQVDHRIRARHRSGDRRVVADIGRHRGDLADIPHRLEEQRPVGPPDRDADAVSPAGELAHGVASDEARTAENGCCGRSHAATPSIGRLISAGAETVNRAAS